MWVLVSLVELLAWRRDLLSSAQTYKMMWDLTLLVEHSELRRDLTLAET